MLTVTTNDTHTHELNPADWSELDIQRLPNGAFHVIRDQKSYTIEIIDEVLAEKSLTLRINGRTYTTVAADELDQLLKKLGMNAGASAKLNNIKAPMPGLILEVIAEVGQTIEKGDSLLILEAMKMENVIKAAGNGTIKSINVQKGATVEKNQVMIELA